MERIKLHTYDFIVTVNMHKSIPAENFMDAQQILLDRCEIDDWHKFVADPFMVRGIVGDGWQFVIIDNQPRKFGCAEPDHDEFSIKQD
jgi:hypothetical protein